MAGRTARSIVHFPLAITTWREKSEANRTIRNLETHFNHANQERLRNTTTSQAGYKATEVPGTQLPSALALTNNTENVPPFPKWNYCWTHGLNKSHDSKTCKSPKDGHVKHATLNNMCDGSATILKPRPRNNNN